MATAISNPADTTTDKDSVVHYDFYPKAYTPESKDERWIIRKLTTDSLVVYVHKSTVMLNGDTLNTASRKRDRNIHSQEISKLTSIYNVPFF